MKNLSKDMALRSTSEMTGQPNLCPSDEVKALIFQGLRELLVNVVKHAGASGASVTIQKEGHLICITVEDNGIGFLMAVKRISGPIRSTVWSF